MLTNAADRRIQAVVFDLDNTLTDFMTAKDRAVRAAADAMVDAGLRMDPKDVHAGIFAIYDEVGIEHQRVFNRFLEQHTGEVDDRILASAVDAAHPVDRAPQGHGGPGVARGVLHDGPARLDLAPLHGGVQAVED